MKKLVSLVFAIITILNLSIPCLAANVTEDFTGNYNVSPIAPWENISTRGTSSPTSAWNVLSQGPYEFSGKAAYSRLYLSKLIYGGQHFKATITNRSYTDDLTVNPHDSIVLTSYPIPTRSSDCRKFELAPGKQYFCLSFEAPSDFEGSVSEWVPQ